MQKNTTLNNYKVLDNYSMLIISKYFQTESDYVNIICVNSKFKETTEKLRYNPIPIKSLKLFPKVQTQHLYGQNEKRIKIKQIVKYEAWYKITYDQFLQYKEDNVKYHNVTYTSENRKKYGNNVSTQVSILGNECFSFCTSLTIDLPSSIKMLGYQCFHNCLQLSSINLPSAIKSIGNQCFDSCASLSSIIMPSSLTNIGSGCFWRCTSLTSINLPSTIISIGNYCFWNCNSLNSIKLPFNLTSIGAKSFYSCSLLSHIDFPSSLQLIGDECFTNCYLLTSITLPSKLKSLGRRCFGNCRFLKSIELPPSIQSLGVECFWQCTSLTNLDLQYIDKEFTFQVSYDDSKFYSKFRIKCTNIVLTSYDVKKLIEERKQENNEEKQFIVPNGVSEINDKVFSFQNLESIIIPTTVTSINNKCFMNCGTLTFISIPNNVKTIEMGSFEGCTSLKEISLPLNENNKYPFKTTYDDYLILNKFGINCERIVFKHNGFKLKTKDIPKDIPLIFDAKATTNIKTIQKNIISLKFNHLSTAITSITIPTSVTYLCDNCFKSYLKLQSITIPTTIKYIGKHLIDGCTSLTRLNYKGDWNDVVVSYDDHLRYKTNGLIFNNIEYTNDDSIKYGNVIPSIVHSLHYSCYDRSNQIFHIPNHITSLDNNMFSLFSNGICINLPHLKALQFQQQSKQFQNIVFHHVIY